MKQNKSARFLFILFFILPLKLFAQQDVDITGVWKGHLFNDTTSQLIPYELAISEHNGKLIGYSYSLFKGDSTDEVGIKRVKIKKKGNKITIEDIEMISNSYTVAAPKKIRKLIEVTLTAKDSVMIMNGSWRTNWTKEYHPITGTIEVKRKNDLWKKDDPLMKKLDELKLSNELSFNQPKENNQQPPVANTIASSGQVKKSEEKNIIKPSIDTTAQSVALAKEIKKQKKAEEKMAAAATKDSLSNARTIAKKNAVATKDSINNAKAAAKQLETAVKDSMNNAKLVAKQLAKKEKKNEDVVTQELAAKRKTAAKRSIFFHTDSLVITLYDNGVVDGDTVSVLMNGNVIFSKEGLSEKPITKTIYTNTLPDSISLVLFAENLGSIPPNTGLMIIYDGKNRNEVFFSADLQNNDAIVLRRRKEN